MLATWIFCCGVALCVSTTTAQQAGLGYGYQSGSPIAGGLLGATVWNNQGGNGSSVQPFEAPVTTFFGQVARGEVFGLKKCKKPKDCALGLRCDLFLNLCVPFNTPILQEFEKPCSSDSQCSGMHVCQGGSCRFCGPKSCRSSLDCCAGSFAQAGKAGSFYECLNTKDEDKVSIARQLGRIPAGYQPIPKSEGGRSLEDAYEVDSKEQVQLGLPPRDLALQGKRCWARCNVDTDCYDERTPLDIKQATGCCNNVCNRRSACPVVSPLVIRQAQLLQQQRVEQQQQFVLQQQALQSQRALQLLSGQGGWGTGGGQQQYQYGTGLSPAVATQPETQYYAAPLPFLPGPAAPRSWQESQQTGPSQYPYQASQAMPQSRRQ